MPVQKNKKEIKLVLSQVAGYSDLLSLSGNLPKMALNTCFLYHCKSPHTSKYILIEYINTSYEVEAAQSRFDVEGQTYSIQ